jgi:hypothetical protein
MDVKLMTLEELVRECEAFYAFTNATGMRYLSERGMQRFNQLKGELAVRTQQPTPEQQLATWNAMSQRG